MYISLHYNLWVIANRPKLHAVFQGGRLQRPPGLTDSILGTTALNLQGDTLFSVICRDTEKR